jgi:hypothetical protein
VSCFFCFQDNTQDLLHSHRLFYLRTLFLYLQTKELDVSDS